MTNLDVAELGKEVGALLVERIWALVGVALTANEVEDILVPLLRQAGCTATVGLVEAGAQRKADEAVKAGAVRHRRSTVRFHSVYGTVEIQSPYLLRRGQGGVRPASELGVKDGGRSRRVERALLDFGSETSYQRAADTFKEHYGFEIERTAILRLVDRYGECAKEFADKRFGEGTTLFELPLAGRPGVDRCFVEMDGCELRTGRLVPCASNDTTPVRGLQRRKRLTEWRDVRMALVWPDGSVDPTYVGRLDTLAAVVSDLHGAACLRGLSPRTEVVACSDGGNGYLAAFQSVFPGVKFVLDRPHLVQNLYEAAEAQGLEGDARAQWADRLAALCDGGHVDVVLDELAAYAGTGKERVVRLHGYITRFRDCVHYDHYRALGWPIGAGRVESCHRHIPQRRLKLPGTWWSEATLPKMLGLRVIRANGWWDEFWTDQAKKAA